MANPWFPSSNASALSPSRFTAGDGSIPPLPPDPPDPDFPPLSSSSPKPSRASRASLQTAKSKGPAVKLPPILAIPTIVESSSAGSASNHSIVSGFGQSKFGSGNTVPANLEKFIIFPPKPSSPIQTNSASNISIPPSPFTKPLPTRNPTNPSPPVSNPRFDIPPPTIPAPSPAAHSVPDGWRIKNYGV
ncbi:leucine-rich repeat extensin-like protein 5 [Brassica rapa]|uniref:leucine-rich repeat extensin-like protein 5 n=1 Tax=Brassica campestris TaxID=3711 RepID=UPI0004F1A866|nr:leucine-rich repeat extensin-like protein 5 [Brassica rapa]